MTLRKYRVSAALLALPPQERQRVIETTVLPKYRVIDVLLALPPKERQWVIEATAYLAGLTKKLPATRLSASVRARPQKPAHSGTRAMFRLTRVGK